jgi:hypothetical protein
MDAMRIGSGTSVKKGAWGGRQRWMENRSGWDEGTYLSSATHPLWPRILEHVYKTAMRDVPVGQRKPGWLFVA